MAQTDTLTRKQKKFISAVLVSRTIEDAALVAGIARRTAFRYLALPKVKDALNAALDALQGQNVRRLSKESGAAIDTLSDIHKGEDNPAGARVSAARVLVEAGPKLREQLELSDRVTELERQQEATK